jgi:hypothetical protein
MHRKIKSRARQTRRHQKKPLAVAKEINARFARLEGRLGNEIALLILRCDHLSRKIDAHVEEIHSLKRMIHAETMLRANVKPDASMEKPDGSRALNPNTDTPTE